MTLKQFAIEQAVNGLMDFRRRYADHHSLRFLSRELENVISYAVNPAAETGETLTEEWLEKTKSAINETVRDAQNAVGLGDPLWSQLTTARSLGLQLARLLWEVSEQSSHKSHENPDRDDIPTERELAAAKRKYGTEKVKRDKVRADFACSAIKASAIMHYVNGTTPRKSPSGKRPR
ncbi:MAG: hypothetical protein U0941_10620 [Planctomycetaceae bacterium]